MQERLRVGTTEVADWHPRVGLCLLCRCYNIASTQGAEEDCAVREASTQTYKYSECHSSICFLRNGWRHFDTWGNNPKQCLPTHKSLYNKELRELRIHWITSKTVPTQVKVMVSTYPEQNFLSMQRDVSCTWKLKEKIKRTVPYSPHQTIWWRLSMFGAPPLGSI